MSRNRFLYLMRTGAACNRRQTDDFRRPLSASGRQAVLSQLDSFRQPDGIRPDCIFCSTATRARQTSELVLSLFVGTPIFFRDSLYLAPTFRILDILRTIDPIFFRILLIGHHTGLEQLIPLLTLPDQNIRLQPADCAVLSVQAPFWSALSTGSAEFQYLFSAH